MTIKDVEKLEIGNVDFIVPGGTFRAWRAPEGYFTVYEGYFTCGLRFPLSSLLLDYLDKRKIALSQLAPASISNFITLRQLGRTINYEIDLAFFEGVTSLCKVKDEDNLFYVKMRPGCDIICGAPNKIKNWKRRFFFVRKNEVSVFDNERTIRTCWSRDVDQRTGKALVGAKKRKAEEIRDLSHIHFAEIVKKREEKKKNRKTRPPKMDAAKDYSVRIDDIFVEEDEQRSPPRVDAQPVNPPEPLIDQLPSAITVVDPPSAQLAANLPEKDKAVVPESTEKTKKKSSRSEKSKKRKAESSLLSQDRYADYRQVGFISDKEACADLLYGLKHVDAPARIPPLGELEAKDAYVKYAHAELKNKAFLNSVFLDYERKLKDARQAGDAGHLAKLKAELDSSLGVIASSSQKLNEYKRKIKALQEDLEAKQKDLEAKSKDLDEARSRAAQYFEDLDSRNGSYGRSLGELKAVGEYSHGVMARADRLRERLVYLDKTKFLTRQLEQVRSNLVVLGDLRNAGLQIPRKVFDRMEKDKADLEAQLLEFPAVELRDGDLSPFEAYVPISDEFEEYLPSYAPLEHGVDDAMHKANDAGENENARDPDARDGGEDPSGGRSNEEEVGEKNPPAE